MISHALTGLAVLLVHKRVSISANVQEEHQPHWQTAPRLLDTKGPWIFIS